MLNSRIEKETSLSEKYLKSIERINFYVFLVFISSLFVLEKNTLNKMFYVNIVFFVIFLFWDRKVLLQTMSCRVFQVVLLFFTYLLVRTVFSDNFNFDSYFRDLKSCVRILVFLIALGYFLSRKKEREIILCIIVFAAILGGTIAFAEYFMNGWPHKFRPIGKNTNFDHHIYFGGSFAVVALISSHIINFRFFNININRIVVLMAGSYSVLLVYMSQSRSALLGLALAFLIYILAFSKRKLTHLFTCFLTGGVLVAIGNKYFFDAATLIARKDAGRFKIWGIAFDRILEAPFFGNGLSADLTIEYGHKILAKPHSLFLSIALIGGLLGLVLFLMVFLFSIMETCKKGQDPFSRLVLPLLVFAVLFHTFDSLTIFDKPTVDWAILWLPISMAMALEQMQKNSVSSAAQQDSEVGRAT